MAPLPPGQTVYALLTVPGQAGASSAIEGVLIEGNSSTLVVAVPTTVPTTGVVEVHDLGGGQPSFQLLRVPSVGVTTSKPASWRCDHSFRPRPNLSALLKKYYKQERAVSDAEVSGEAVPNFHEVAALQRRLAELERQLAERSVRAAEVAPGAGGSSSSRAPPPPPPPPAVGHGN